MEPIDSNVMGNQVGGNEVLKGWNHFSVKSNGSNFNCIHFNWSIKLDMQGLRERT